MDEDASDRTRPNYKDCQAGKVPGMTGRNACVYAACKRGGADWGYKVCNTHYAGKWRWDSKKAGTSMVGVHVAPRSPQRLAGTGRGGGDCNLPKCEQDASGARCVTLSQGQVKAGKGCTCTISSRYTVAEIFLQSLLHGTRQLTGFFCGFSRLFSRSTCDVRVKKK